MLLRLLCVGRRARDPLLAAADDYVARLEHYTRCELVRVKESTPAGEADALLAQVAAGDWLVALDERASQSNTATWVRKVTAWRNAGRSVAFVIGGADGLHERVKARANELAGLSALTLPHRLAQVVLLEQLYRVHTVLRGEKYHRA